MLENLIFDRCMKRNHYFCLSRGPPKPAWRVLGGILESSWRFLENLGGVLDASWKHLESKDVFLKFPWRAREASELWEHGLVAAIRLSRALLGSRKF